MPTFTTLKERNFGGPLTVCSTDCVKHVEHDRKEARKKTEQEKAELDQPFGLIAYTWKLGF